MLLLQQAYEQMHTERSLSAAEDAESDTGDGDGVNDATSTRKRRRRRWPWIVLSILVVLILLAGVGLVFLLQAMQVRDDLQDAKARITEVVPLVKAGQTDAVAATASDVLELTQNADEIVDGPLWQIAAAVPFVGQNVAAVSETTKATHVLVRDAMPIALELLATLDVEKLRVEGGGINLQPFRDIQPKLPPIKAAFGEAKAHVDTIDRDAILPFVDENIGQLIDIIDQTTPLLTTVEKYLPDILSILGDGGERTYALLFQNNAESRATGGNPGAGAIMTITDGKVEMREDREVLRYYMAGQKGYSPQEIEAEEKQNLFEPDTGRYSQNFTRLPHFPDAASMFTGLWTDRTDGHLDGVISLDPVVLSYMLSVAGPVQIEGEREAVTAENAVSLLLFDTYERFGTDGLASDEYFAKVSSAVFKHVMGGGWDPVAMLEQLQKSAEEQRLYLWFTNESEQAMSIDLGLDGAVDATNEDSTQLGIYLNDASYSKLEYFLSTSMAVTCSAENRTVTTSITLNNAVPSADLNGYTLNWRGNKLGVPRTTMVFDVLSMALPGGQFVATEPAKGDKNGWDREGVYNGRAAKSLFITVPMGESRTVSFTSTVPEDATPPLSVRYTPTVTQTPVTIDASCGEMFPAGE
ncbi:DUF4012 domain-containing protein [Microbacterium sp. YJN-G]|uniref:DUF4012 domain-containing protein n=1 Tax=Microbacterium sp. YJN-G TaxID=2763257 RepID=UPI0018780891|nr:DUF4012 domain-containing protein [Microbacterium sp. YJN-G]